MIKYRKNLQKKKATLCTSNWWGPNRKTVDG